MRNKSDYNEQFQKYFIKKKQNNKKQQKPEESFKLNGPGYFEIDINILYFS